MADNVLKAVITVTAPGAQQAFKDVASGAQQAEGSIKGLGTSVTKTGGVIRQMAPEVNDVSLSLKDQRSILVSLKREFASLSTEQARGFRGRELAADIKIANAEIKRLEAGAVSSFGNIGKSATKGFSAIRQLAFILPGLGIAGIFNLAFTAIESVIGSLFNLNTGFKDGEIAAALFKQALDDISDSAEKLKKRLDFQDDIAKLKASISGLKGPDLDILDLGNRTKSAVELISKEQDITDGLKRQRNEVAQLATEYIAAGLASQKFIQLTALASSGKAVPKTLVSQLTSNEKLLAESYVDILSKIETSSKRSSDAQELIGKNFLRIQEEQRKKQQELLEKSKSDYEKFVSETISQAKKLDSAFKNVIDITPNFSVLDTRNEEFKKALGFLKKFDAGTFKITLKPELDDKEFKEAINLFGKKFNNVKFDIVLPLEFPIDPKVIPQTQAEITRVLKEIASFKPEPVSVTADLSLDLAVKVDQAGAVLGTRYAQAFRDAVKKGLQQGLIPDEAIAQALEKINRIKAATDAINQSIETIATAGVASVGEALGNILSTGGIGDAFKRFGSIVGQEIENIGKQMIQLGIEAAGLKEALAALFSNPAALIAAGIALVAIGAAIKNSLGKGISGFEAGGRPPVGRPSIVGEKGPEIFVPDRPGLIIPNHRINNWDAFTTPKKGMISYPLGVENKQGQQTTKNSSKSVLVTFVEKDYSNISKQIYEALQSIATTIIKQSDSVLRSVIERVSKTEKVNTPEIGVIKNSSKSSSLEKEVNNFSTAVASVIKTAEKSKETDHFKEVPGERVTSKTDNKLILKELIGGINYPEKQGSSTVSREKVGQTTTKNRSESVLVSLLEKGYTSFSDSSKLIKESFTTNSTDSQKEIKTSVSALVDSIREYESILSKFVSSKNSTNSDRHSENTTSERLIKLIYDRERSTHSILKTTAKELSRFVSTNKNTYVDKSLSSVLKSFTHTIGFRAKGGPVDWTKPFIVGERGPEIFEPRRSGRIVPNHKITRNVFNQVRNNNRSVTGSNKNVFSTGNRSFSNRHKEEKNFLYNLSRTDNSMRSLSSITNKPFAGFRSNGGNAVAGTSLIVGGGGVELFIPNTGQSIVNNNNTSNGSSVSGGTLNVKGRIEISGRNLVAVLENEKRSQRQLS